jgi:hypothetical protein
LAHPASNPKEPQAPSETAPVETLDTLTQRNVDPQTISVTLSDNR